MVGDYLIAICPCIADDLNGIQGVIVNIQGVPKKMFEYIQQSALELYEQSCLSVND